MPIKVLLGDGSGKGKTVVLSEQGEILVRQLKFDEVDFKSISVADTAVNFFKAKPNQRFVITGIILNTNKDVGVNGAIIDIYEASSDSATVIDKSLLRLNLLNNQTTSVIPILLGVNEGKFVNGKSDDTIVNASVVGYFIDV